MLILPVIIFCVAITITLLNIFISIKNNNEDTIILTRDELREIIRLTITETIKQLEKE